MPTIEQLQARITELETENALLSQDVAFGGFTKQAFFLEFERRKESGQYFVFIDLDNIHGLDRELGETKVDEMIHSSYSFALRESDLVVFGRVEGGDEEGFIIKGDPEGFVTRLHASLNANGLSGIADYTTIENHDLNAAIEKTRANVTAAKNARGTQVR